MTRTQRYIEMARKVALQSAFRYRVGCIIVSRGIVIAAECNSLRHQSVLHTNHWEGSLHSEVAALARVLRDGRREWLKGASMYVVRVNKAGSLAMALPCHNCHKEILTSGVKRCYYSNSDGLISEIRL